MTATLSPVAQRLAQLEELQAVRLELAALKAKRAAKRAERYRSDPVAWVAECVTMREVAEFGARGWRGVWSKQREILEALRAGRSGDKTRRRVAVKSCHGVGKATSPRSSRRGGWRCTRRVTRSW